MAKHLRDNKLDDQHPITSLYNILLDIHEKKTPDRFNKILQELAQVFFNSQYKELKISFVIDAGKDPDFNKFYEEFLKYKIEDQAQNIDLTPFFPSDCAIDKETIHNVRQVIEQLFPHAFLKQYEKITWK